MPPTYHGKPHCPVVRGQEIDRSTTRTPRGGGEVDLRAVRWLARADRRLPHAVRQSRAAGSAAVHVYTWRKCSFRCLR